MNQQAPSERHETNVRNASLPPAKHVAPMELRHDYKRFAPNGAAART
jgi:hypothetical protein